MANEFTGRTGCATIGSGTNLATLNIKGWKVRITATEHRTDNTGSGSFSDRISSMKDAAVDLDANLDASALCFDTPPNIRAGANLTNVKLYLQGTANANAAFIFPVFKVLDVSVDSSVADTTKYAMSGANKGTFTYPTGTFTPDDT